MFSEFRRLVAALICGPLLWGRTFSGSQFSLGIITKNSFFGGLSLLLGAITKKLLYGTIQAIAYVVLKTVLLAFEHELILSSLVVILLPCDFLGLSPQAPGTHPTNLASTASVPAPGTIPLICILQQFRVTCGHCSETFVVS